MMSPNPAFLALDVAAFWHRKQKRKYTGDPYVNHLIAVTRLVAEYSEAWGRDDEVLAAAALHDCIEDQEIERRLIENLFGRRVLNLVLELTDAPQSAGNRKKRKALDRARLSASSAEAKTIKLADMIDNTRSIAVHDPNFAVVYLGEKELLLPCLALPDNEPLYAIAEIELWVGKNLIPAPAPRAAAPPEPR